MFTNYSQTLRKYINKSETVVYNEFASEGMIFTKTAVCSMVDSGMPEDGFLKTLDFHGALKQAKKKRSVLYAYISRRYRDPDRWRCCLR